MPARLRIDVMTDLGSTLAIIKFSDAPHKQQDKLELIKTLLDQGFATGIALSQTATLA